MRYLVRIAFFVCCVGFHVSAQQNNATPVNPWKIKEVSAFHTLLHGITLQSNERENCRILVNAWTEIETAFDELQHASLPEQYAAAYAVFVDSIRVPLDQFRNARDEKNCENLRGAFDALDDTFERAVPRLIKMLNEN